MALRQQTYYIVRLVNDYGEQDRDVTAQHANVEGIESGYSRVPATEEDLARILPSQLDLSFDNDRIG